MPQVDATAARTSPGRRKAFRITTVALGVLLGLAGFAFLSLVAPWFYGPERDIHRVHDLGWGAAGGLLLAAPMIALGWVPERRVAVMQGILVAMAAFVIAVALTLRINPFLPVFLVVGSVLVVLYPVRPALLQPGRVSWPLLAVAVAGAVPFLVYALGEAEIARACPPGSADPHCSEYHWMTQAALGLAIPLVALVAAVRAPGWRIPAWAAGAAAILFGAASLAFPTHASSVGAAWGAVSVVGGAVFIALAEWEARRG